MDPERPIAFMVEHRKDLDLADSQVTKLNLIQNRLDAADRPAHLALDTLPDAPTKAIDWAHITPGGRDSLIARRRAVSQANGAMHDNARTARTDALAVLTPEQQTRLTSVNQQMVNKQFDASRPKSSSSGRGGPPGGQSSGGGRPY
jgi:hypothetical protein